MEKSIYYEVVLCENDSPNAYYKYSRNWNVKNIAGYDHANGYIVQEVHISNTVDLGELFKTYYEAWAVIDGKCSKDNSNEADDTFHWDGFGNETQKVLGKKGEISYQTSVYWVDRYDPQYYIPDSWEEGAVPEAGELKSILVEDCPEFQNNTKIFDSKFVHIVDFEEYGIIRQTLVSNYYNGEAKRNMSLREYLRQFLEETQYESILNEIP